MRGSSGSEWINRWRVGVRVASMRGRCACMCDSVRHTRHAMELLYKRDQNDAHCVGRVPRARHGNTCHEHHSALETRACIGDRARAPRAAESGIVPKTPSVSRDWEGDNQVTKKGATTLSGALDSGEWCAFFKSTDCGRTVGPRGAHTPHSRGVTVPRTSA